MKKGLFALLAVMIAAVSFAQNEKYMKAMEPKVAMVDSNNTTESWKDLANAFERIADAEKTQWMPYYYASFCNVMAGYSSMPQDGNLGDNSSISDPYADKAEQLLNKAEALAQENSEIYCVRKMVYSLRMMGNPMARYMTEGAKASEALSKAKTLNENNPRVYILEGQDKFYTPEQFGGSKEEAKKLFEKANGIFMVSKPGSAIEPQWGRSQVNYFLSQLK
jgi:hypothetical protein